MAGCTVYEKDSIQEREVIKDDRAQKFTEITPDRGKVSKQSLVLKIPVRGYFFLFTASKEDKKMRPLQTASISLFYHS